MSMPSLFHIAYRATRRADDRMVARVLELAGICRRSSLGAELEAMLRQRMSDCRDLFVSRGVARPQRLSVLALAGQRIAQDPDCAARMKQVSPRHGPALLRAVCALMEVVGAEGFPSRQARAVTDNAAATSAPAPMTPVALQAANDSEPGMDIDLHDAAEALRIVHRQLQHADASHAQSERLAA